MTKSERLEVRLDSDLRARVEAEAARQGRTLTETVRRTLEAMLSDAEGTLASEQSGPVPVLSANPEKGNAAEGVRPAASPRTSEPAFSAFLAGSGGGAEDAAPDTESGKGTTTAPKPTSPRTHEPAASKAVPSTKTGVRKSAVFS